MNNSDMINMVVELLQDHFCTLPHEDKLTVKKIKKARTVPAIGIFSLYVDGKEQKCFNLD